MRSVFCAAVAALVFAGSLQGVADCNPSNQESRDTTEIKKLIAELGDDSYKVRSLAAKRLEEIGVPALPALELAARHGDLESQLRAKRAIEQIWNASIVPTTVNGIDFRLFVDTQWELPAPGITSSISVRFHAKNSSKSASTIVLGGNSIKLNLKSATGTEYLKDFSIETAASNTVRTATLAIQDEISIPLSVRLRRSKDTATFVWNSPLGTELAYSGLPRGTYQFSLTFSTDDFYLTADKTLWSGRAEIPSAPITIR